MPCRMLCRLMGRPYAFDVEGRPGPGAPVLRDRQAAVAADPVASALNNLVHVDAFHAAILRWLGASSAQTGCTVQSSTPSPAMKPLGAAHCTGISLQASLRWIPAPLRTLPLRSRKPLGPGWRT